MSRFLLAAAAAAMLGSGCAASMQEPQTTAFLPAVRSPPVKPGQVRVRFLGVTTLLLDDGETRILVDGYFSRPSLGATLFGTIEPNPQRITEGLERGDIQSLAAVLVVHGHLDHAMDAPEVASRTGAVVVGTESVRNIALGHRAPPPVHVAEPGKPIHCGRFTITAFPVPHSKPISYQGSIREPLIPPREAAAYSEDAGYAYWIQHEDLTFLVHPGANYSKGMYDGSRGFPKVETDVVFLSVGALGWRLRPFIDRYWAEVVTQTRARTVIPVHWDDFNEDARFGLTRAGFPLDGFRSSLRLTREAAARAGAKPGATPVDLRFLPTSAPVDLPLNASVREDRRPHPLARRCDVLP